MTEAEKNKLRNGLIKCFGEVILTIDVTLQNSEDNEALFDDDNSHVCRFDVWDGFAYCYDHNGHEYSAIFPKRSFGTLCQDFSNKIREYLSLDEKTPIDPVHIFEVYGKFKKVK